MAPFIVRVRQMVSSAQPLIKAKPKRRVATNLWFTPMQLGSDWLPQPGIIPETAVLIEDGFLWIPALRPPGCTRCAPNPMRNSIKTRDGTRRAGLLGPPNLPLEGSRRETASALRRIKPAVAVGSGPAVRSVRLHALRRERALKRGGTRRIAWRTAKSCSSVPDLPGRA